MKFKRICALALCLATIGTTCLVTTGCSNGSSEQEDSSAAQNGTDEEYWYTIDTTNRLSNPNATAEAAALYNFICDIQGQYCLSGQQENTGNNAMSDLQTIQSISGKMPAIRGIDFINNSYDTAVLHAESWWKIGGIVTICWHMGVPPNGVGYESSQGTYDLDAALTEGTQEYEDLITMLDAAVPALLQLQEDGIPVLWRPFHEFDGEWFWWGKDGSENFIKLWQLMYDRYTNYWGINNLIWVLGYSGSIKTDWYPGDEYVDIIGADTYGHDESYASMYNRLGTAVSDSKPRALHECGYLPSADAMVEKESLWSWFMLWHSDYLNDAYNTEEEITALYNSEYILTLDELPNLKQQLEALSAE